MGSIVTWRKNVYEQPPVHLIEAWARLKRVRGNQQTRKMVTSNISNFIVLEKRAFSPDHSWAKSKFCLIVQKVSIFLIGT